MLFKKKSTYDYIVAGLGNPGKEYQKTKHNVGFMVADALVEECGASFKKSKFTAETADIRINGSRVLVIKPLTYMNLSGEAIIKAINFYKIDPQNLIVVFDDIALDPGKIRVRRKGSDGGHNGIKNIVQKINSNEFKRVRIGVGAKPTPEYDLKDWVLSNFSKENLPKIQQAITLGTKAVKTIITEDVDTAMCRFNGA